MWGSGENENWQRKQKFLEKTHIVHHGLHMIWLWIETWEAEGGHEQWEDHCNAVLSKGTITLRVPVYTYCNCLKLL
jgi:hypothetical protein